MRKLLTLVVLGLVALRSNGQSITLSLTTAPCHVDGVLTANTVGLTTPFTVTWHLHSGTIVHTVTSGTSDVLTSYSGEYVYAVASNATVTGVYATYAGMPPFTYTYTTTAAVCPTLGTATMTVTGGTAPYTYQWYTNPGSALVSTSNPANLAAGNYDVMVTDAAGCMYGSVYNGDSIAIYNTPVFSYSVATTPASCTNGTATIGAISGGGTPPYSYSWVTGATTSSISGLHLGYYPVTVTDALGCYVDGGAYISQSVSITAPITPTPATCLASDGAVIAFGAGGVPPYSYVWSNGATTAAQSGLSAGYYTVVVTDANGCIGNGGASVSASTPITATYTATASSCTAPTGTASLTVTGGTTPYSIAWYTTPPQTGLSATALHPGTYGFHITDAVGCVRTGNVVVNPQDIISLGFSSSPATCTLANGSASVAAYGGVGPYTYSWSTGGASAGISGLHSGYYNVSVHDANSCAVGGYVNVADYSPLHVSLASTQPSCLFTADGSITATASSGTAPYTYNWSGGGTGATLSSIGSGYYSVYVTDNVGCTLQRTTILNAGTANTSCYCTIHGTVYHDLNGNCTKDAGETGIPGVQIHCSGRGYVYTDASGNYSFKVPSGSYTITETVQTFYPLSTCQLNNIPVTVVAATGCTNTVNFANTTSTIHDIHISTWDYNHPIPGNAYTQATIVTNEGTVNENAILAGYKADGQIYAPSFIPTSVLAGAPYWYTTGTLAFPTLVPEGSQAIYAHYAVPTDVPLGTSLLFKDSAVNAGPMSNWVNDYTPWNNVNYFTSTVVGSYDPNFKEVSPKGSGAPGYITYADSVLEYMVHFQNTGTYYAENITVIDTLDPNLDWTTLHPVFESHHCAVTLNETGVATFTFNNIHLPYSSSDPETSNGMFTYTVKTRHGLAIGTQIHNSASIYFDYNAPIMTNKTLNTIGSNVGVPYVIAAEASFTLYPNPAENSCFAVINSDVAGDANMKVMDITGKILVNSAVSLVAGKQTVPVDISRLTPGMYFVVLNNAGKAETQKLVIMK